MGKGHVAGYRDNAESDIYKQCNMKRLDRLDVKASDQPLLVHFTHEIVENERTFKDFKHFLTHWGGNFLRKCVLGRQQLKMTEDLA